MVRKVNSNDRRKLLEALGRGLSDSEIKGQFGIKDDRTLRRHLKLALQEQDARTVKTEILKEALRDHLAEVRLLIEKWKAGVRIQPVTAPLSDMTGCMEFLHSSRLFGCLKSHLPFPVLWRDSNRWEIKYSSYTENCKKLREGIQREATTRMNLTGDSALPRRSPLINWILRQVEDKLQKLSEREKLEFRWEYDTEVKRMSVYPSGQELLAIPNQPEFNNEFYENGCRELLGLVLKGETVTNLLALFNDLSQLETKIHDSLEEILLRRDYILYTCNLCPGEPRLLR